MFHVRDNTVGAQRQRRGGVLATAPYDPSFVVGQLSRSALAHGDPPGLVRQTRCPPIFLLSGEGDLGQHRRTERKTRAETFLGGEAECKFKNLRARRAEAQRSRDLRGGRRRSESEGQKGKISSRPEAGHSAPEALRPVAEQPSSLEQSTDVKQRLSHPSHRCSHQFRKQRRSANRQVHHLASFNRSRQSLDYTQNIESK